MSERPTSGSGRVEGIDVARGIASAIMVQGHAYHGWVTDEDKLTEGYLFTRVLGLFPLPAFLVLAGAALCLRIEAAIRKGEDAREVRAALVRRGLTILFVGYAVSIVSALMDGWDGIHTFTRADVLHVIGLSIMTVGALGVRPLENGKIDPKGIVRLGVGLMILPVVLSPLVSPIGLWDLGPARHVAALFVHVPHISRMPYFPLAGWAGLGVVVVHLLSRTNQKARSIAGAPDRVLVGLLGLSIAMIFGGAWLSDALVAWLGGTLDTRHVAVVSNAIEHGGRGLVILSVGGLLSTRLPAPVKAVLLRLGRGSLIAYVFHMPFAYGRLGSPLARHLDMWTATLFVVLLEIASYLAVVARDVSMAKWASWRASRTSATATATVPAEPEPG